VQQYGGELDANILLQTSDVKSIIKLALENPNAKLVNLFIGTKRPNYIELVRKDRRYKKELNDILLVSINRPDIVKELIKDGANPFATDAFGQAVEEGLDDTVEAMLKAKI